eukprot:1188635-Prorocentrum_minimum.AAC.1
MGLDFNAFLPRTTSKSGAAAIAAEDEFEAMEGMMQKHATVSGILGVRLSSLQAVANCCARQDTRGAVNALSRLVLIFGSGLGVWLQEGGGAVGARGLLVCSRAAAAATDEFWAPAVSVAQRTEQFTLETAAGILPELPLLMESEHTKYIRTAIRAALVLVTAFGELVRTTRQANTAAVRYRI